MTRVARLILVLCLSLAAFPFTLAQAQSPPADDELQRLIDQCQAGQTDPLAEPPSFVREENGEWRCVKTSTPGSWFGWLIPIALLWSAAPMAIAGFIASSRGESIGMALALTFFLGWIGFAIVMFGMRRSASSAQAVFANPPNPEPQTESVADRLVALEDLHTRGLITDEEHETRRTQILSET